MKEYLDYDQKYPDLIVRLVQFFKNNSKGEKREFLRFLFFVPQK